MEYQQFSPPLLPSLLDPYPEEKPVKHCPDFITEKYSIYKTVQIRKLGENRNVQLIFTIQGHLYLHSSSLLMRGSEPTVPTRNLGLSNGKRTCCSTYEIINNIKGTTSICKIFKRIHNSCSHIVFPTVLNLNELIN